MNWREEIEKFLIRNDTSTTSEARPRLDAKGMISRPELLHAIVAEIGDIILKKHPTIKAIGSHGVGGSFLISPIILYVYDHWFTINGFFVRLDAEQNSIHNPIEGCLEREWRVVIVDTLIKTGNSSLRAYEILQEHGCEVDGIIIVADLSGGDNACTRAGLKVDTLIAL